MKLKNGLANVLSEKRKHEAEIEDLKLRIAEITKEKVILINLISLGRDIYYTV